MKIKIPHIGYTVYVKPMPKDSPKGWTAFAEKTTEASGTIFINRPVKVSDIGTLIHEATHILSYICEVRHIDFKTEKEHCAYILEFIICTILGFRIKEI